MSSPRMADLGRWAPTIATWFSLALLSGLLVYWSMQLLAPQVTIAPSGSLVSQNKDVDTSSSRLLFGSANGSQSASSSSGRPAANIEVVGVAASSFRAAAILAVNGAPAKAYGVGTEIEEGMTVESVTSEEVVVDRDGEKIRIAVPNQADLAILTSGQDADAASATSAPTSTRPAGSGRRAQPAARRGGTGARPALPPRRLPPAGAAAAAAATQNTTGVTQPGTPGAGRPAGTRRATPAGQPPRNRAQGRAPARQGAAPSRAAAAARTRLGNPAQPANNGQQAPVRQENRPEEQLESDGAEEPDDGAGGQRQ